MDIKIVKGEEVLFEGHPADAKEYVQDLFQAEYGMEPDLQENDPEDDGEYLLYLHSEAYEDLTEAQIAILDELEVTEDIDPTTKAIQDIFGITFELVE